MRLARWGGTASLAATALLAAVSASAQTSGATFTRNVAPILQEHCQSCHRSGSMAGIVSVYQRHDYAAEKRDALARWADHVDAVVSGRKANIVTLRDVSGITRMPRPIGWPTPHLKQPEMAIGACWPTIFSGIFR